MNIDIKVPSVGESITEVVLVQWLKSEGDYVEMDEVVAELESDKATFELPAEASGTLHLIAKEGDTIPIGEVVCSIKTSDKQQQDTSLDTQQNTPLTNQKTVLDNKETRIDIKVPSVGESITEVVLIQWLKSEGDSVEMDEVVAELESDKATFELPAEASGTLHLIAKEGDTIPIGEVVCFIKKGDTSVNNIEEKPIENKTVKKEEITNKIESLSNKKPDTAPVSNKCKEDSTCLTTQNSNKEGRIERRNKMTSLRKTISKRLVAVKNETAMLTTFNEINMQPIMDIRAKYKDIFKEKYGVSLGFMSFFTKASTIALKEFPSVNARIESEDIVYSEFVDLSIAVSAPKGLVVPVVRNAEKLSLHEIEKYIAELALKARENKITIEEMTGGTFTITNGGVFGSMMSTPIINSPQSAILGMHNIIQRPIAENGQVVIRPMMYVALSYDHRIIDGRESVGFLVKIKQLLEEPTSLLF